MPDPFDALTDEKLSRMVGALSQLPPPKVQPLIVEPTETCLCGKKVAITTLEALNTGVFTTLSDICKGCIDGARIDRELARIVCASCKRVLTRVKPSRDKTGFVFLAGRSYHTSECTLCNPDVERCPIIEKVLWDRKNSIT